MKPTRTIEVLNKLKEKHEANPDLYMPDITNEEIVTALATGIRAVKTLVDITIIFVREDEDEDSRAS